MCSTSKIYCSEISFHAGLSLLQPLPITLVWNCLKQRENSERRTLSRAKIVYSDRVLTRNAFLELIENVIPRNWRRKVQTEVTSQSFPELPRTASEQQAPKVMKTIYDNPVGMAPNARGAAFARESGLLCLLLLAITLHE